MVMQAIRVHAYGGPEVMQLEDLPLPVPGPGQALVRVHAASVNFLDVQKRRGELAGQAFYQRAGEPEFPTTLGSQGVGRQRQLSIRIARTYALADAAQAHAAFEMRQISGRVLLLPWLSPRSKDTTRK